MTRLSRLALALVLGATAVCCASDPLGAPVKGTEADDLCALACESRSEAGCLTDVAACADTCSLARVAGYCAEELDARLVCQASAPDLRCGRVPTGGPCDDEGVALERCLSLHSVGNQPPDCYGKECSWQCGPIGKQLCTPDQSSLCECPSGASGTRTCSSDGCFWSPCDCQL